jgi:hypothetical protein
MEFGNSILKPAEGLFIESFSLFLSLLTYFSYNSPLPFALCYSLLTLIGDLNALERL